MIAALAFLAEHSDLIVLLVQAIEQGVSKDSLKDRIKAEMTLASDAAIEKEFPGT